MEKSSESDHNDIVGYLELIKWEQAAAKELSHLYINEQAKIKELLHGEYILAWSLRNLRSAEVLV